MTPEEEIAGLKNILNGWKKNAKHYEAAVESIRELVAPYTEQMGMLAAIHNFCNDILAYDKQCPTCGDHDCSGGLPCESGDWV